MHMVRDQHRGFTEIRLVLTHCPFTAQPTPVDIHNPRNGHVRLVQRLVSSDVVGQDGICETVVVSLFPSVRT